MTRRHDIDALRALAFALLILYHLAMLYVADWDWHLKSPHLAEWLQWPMLFLNRWRMDLIFLLSGIASAFLLRPQDGVWRFVRARNWRLMIPLLFGMAVVVPVQPYVQGVANGAVQPGFGTFLLDYFLHRRQWPENAFSGWEHSLTWNHLWYLFYLWVYTLALALLAKPFETETARRWRARFAGLRGPALLLLPALPLFAWTWLLQPRFPEKGDFFSDWYRNAMYFSVFLYGYLLARESGFWREALRLRKASLGIAMASVAIYLGLVATLPDEVSAPMQAFVWGVRNLYLWTMLLAILGWGHALLNRPFRWLPWANENVYPWYILHQSLIIAFAYWLLPLRLPALAEAGLVLALTVAGCWLVTACVRRVRWLRPLFGLKALARKESARAPLLHSPQPQ
jgi:peptidoglycan/LPS O-acetylase OafA/YrhL